MNYCDIYDLLITKRRKDILTENYHIHHIIPKCIGGNNEPDNLVRLNYREHCIAHLLLCKIHQHDYNKENYYKLCYAVQMMRNSIVKKIGNFNSHLYDYFIKERNKHVGEISKIRYRNTSIYKNIKTGEHKQMNIYDGRLKSGEWVGIQKGEKVKGKKGVVSIIDENGNRKQVTKEEFDNNPNLKGVNFGRKGLFDNINSARKSMIWWERIMYSDCHRKKPKDISNKPNLLYFLENIYILVPKMIQYKKGVSKSNFRKILEKNVDSELFSAKSVLISSGHDVIRRIIEKIYIDETPFIYENGFREALADYLRNFNREIKYEN